MFHLLIKTKVLINIFVVSLVNLAAIYLIEKTIHPVRKKNPFMSILTFSGIRTQKICFIVVQILSDELIKEVENSIAEFKRHNQEYDEERVRGQVMPFHLFLKYQCSFSSDLNIGQSSVSPYSSS